MRRRGDGVIPQPIHFNAYRYEFGNALSCGLLMPYNCRRAGLAAETWTRMSFPPSWGTSWFGDGWHNCRMDKREGRRLGEKRDMEKFVFGECGLTDFEPLPVPPSKRQIHEPYVVLIPTLDTHAKKNHHKLELCLNRNGWKIVANHIRSMGMRVVAFTCDEACDKFFAHDLADISFHAEKKVLEPNTFLRNQIEWMSNAVTSVALGGAFHVAFTFAVPGIGFDGQMLKNYKAITASYKAKGKPIHVLPSANSKSMEFGMPSYKIDPAVAAAFYPEYAKVICRAITSVTD